MQYFCEYVTFSLKEITYWRACIISPQSTTKNLYVTVMILCEIMENKLHMLEKSSPLK